MHLNISSGNPSKIYSNYGHEFGRIELDFNSLERIFDLGGMNQKWEAYQGLIKDQKAYKADSNYIKKQEQ